MPDSVIYDIQLTSTLPWSVTVPSAINAMAHAVEALYSPDANDHTDEMALQAVRSIDQGPCPARRRRKPRRSLRTALRGVSGGIVGGTPGPAHKVCHVLGGTFTLPHAPTHAVVLLYVMDYNEPAALGR